MKPMFFVVVLSLAILVTADLAHISAQDDPQQISAELLRGNTDHFNYGRFDHGGKPLTCTYYPKICHGQWMPGPDCCRGQCVNLKFDPFNCGQCGKRCGFGQVCCGGRCVSIMFDKNNCGRCANRCRHGASCTYGMCNYGH